jgi:hypothetical protein
MYPTQLASPLPTASLAQQVGDLQQLCHRQQWQTNAEKVLDELQEAKASMALQQDLLENLIGERTFTADLEPLSVRSVALAVDHSFLERERERELITRTSLSERSRTDVGKGAWRRPGRSSAHAAGTSALGGPSEVESTCSHLVSHADRSHAGGHSSEAARAVDAEQGVREEAGNAVATLGYLEHSLHGTREKAQTERCVFLSSAQDTSNKLECTKNELVVQVQRVVEESNGKLFTSVSDMIQRQREEMMTELIRAEVSRTASEKIALSAALADSETQIEMGALSEESALDDLDIFACGGTDEKKAKTKTKKRKAETKQENRLDTDDYMEKVRNKILNARKKKKKKRDSGLHDSAH